jgi:predicted nuclease with TOPRIM domain
MPRLDDRSRRIRWLLLGLLAAGLGAPWSRADAPAGDEVLRDKGLSRAGPVYVLRFEDDLKDRIAEIRRSSAEYEQIKARLAEDLAVLGRTERRYQEVLQRQQALEAEWQEGSKDQGGPPPARDGFGPPPPPPDRFGPGPQGPSPPPQRGRDPFNPRGSNEFRHRMPPEELGRQYENLQIERGALEVKIVQIQSAVDDLSARLESKASAIQRFRTETVKRYEDLKARYAALGSDSEVTRALAMVNATSGSVVNLGPRDEDSKDVQLLAGDGIGSKGVMPDRRSRIELKGMSRLTALAGAAEAVQQDLFVAARRIQDREHDSEYRQKLIDQAKPGENPARVEKLRTEETRVRQSIRESFAHLAAAQESFLRRVTALRAALDAVANRQEELTADSSARREILRRALGEKAVPILSLDHVVRRLQELEKTIERDTVSVDVDRSILWVDATINGKPGYTMIVDPGAEDVRLSARAAAEVGVYPVLGDGEEVVEIILAGGRHIEARRARLQSVLIGSFTAPDVECVVLPETFGEAPALLGGSFLKRFATRTDTAAGTLELTRVVVKPGGRAAKAAASKPAGTPKPNRPAPIP